MNKKQREQEEARAHLLALIKPGDTIYTMLQHVSRSGMYRVIRLYVIRNNQPVNIDGWASDLLEGYDYRHRGCKASGCGMDMGFHLVHNLGYALWPDGFDCTGVDWRHADRDNPACPSNDHSNGDRDYNRAHRHSSGGYALRHTWMN